ncbi:hypothetical protein [Amycolatopsis speibonae]|uniref:DUF3592 domain-containing protein n=1 Tax=Amycolatopsis speibonae TaxID=1450224 RepID=A0ABV7NN48_9PSEU
MLFQVLAAGIPYVVLLWFVWGAFGDHVGELRTGEDVTVTDVSGCTEEGSPMSGQIPYCAGDWRFDDGRTGRGQIEGARVAEGDRIFAGDGFVYPSRSSLIWRLSVGGVVGLILLGMAIGLGVLYRLDRTRQRREK